MRPVRALIDRFFAKSKAPHAVAQRLAATDGQVIPVLMLFIALFMVACALVVDTGLMLNDRRQAQNAVDLAALAAAQDLPYNSNDPLANQKMNTARTTAISFLKKNGFDPAGAGISATVTTSYQGSVDQIEIKAGRSRRWVFGNFFGTLPNLVVGARAVAQADAKMDLAIVQDDTGTMNGGCNGSVSDPTSQTNAACPVKQARDAVNALVDTLLPSGSATTQITFVPFRGCFSNNNNRYNPVTGETNFAIRGCIIQNQIVPPTTNVTTLHNAINSMSAPGGFPGTNDCLGLYEAHQRLTGAGSNPSALKVIVMISDGDNRYSDGAESSQSNVNSQNGNPVPGVYPTGTYPSNQGGSNACRPTGPTQDNTGYGADYDAIINAMDIATYNLAQTYKAAGYQIIVLRYASPPGDAPATTLCNAGLVGAGGVDRSDPNDIRDQNLERCIATSEAGTNDHYFYAATPQQIPVMFSQIAQLIAQVRLTQ